MDWTSQVTKDLHQAELKRASLKESACLFQSKLKTLQQNREGALAKFDNEIAALQTKRGLLDSQISYEISQLWAPAEECRTALETVERSIAL